MTVWGLGDIMGVLATNEHLMNTSKTYLIPVSVAIILVMLAGFVFFSPVSQNERSLEESAGESIEATVPVTNLDTSGDEESLDLDSEASPSSSSTATMSDEVNNPDGLSTSTRDTTQGGGTTGQLEFEAESE